ncbi:hypothetical protein BU064_13115 [Staphylococcus succinus]|nr:hypothetical protein BU064_13115 [Staphylococcus succinus]
MGTRTAVFQEQENGYYLGIYVHFDGYIEGVGKILENYYKERQKMYKLISNKQPITSLGVENTIIDSSLDNRLIQVKHESGWQKYTQISSFAESEYFLAGTLEDIQNFQYFNYNDKDELDGFTHDSGLFVPFQGSDNNGYLYVQDMHGNWMVSYSNDDGTMCEFEDLKTNLDILFEIND